MPPNQWRQSTENMPQMCLKNSSNTEIFYTSMDLTKQHAVNIISVAVCRVEPQFAWTMIAALKMPPHYQQLLVMIGRAGGMNKH